jgi:hypothetical protein
MGEIARRYYDFEDEIKPIEIDTPLKTPLFESSLLIHDLGRTSSNGVHIL